jgi:hypothetical protein
MQGWYVTQLQRARREHAVDTKEFRLGMPLGSPRKLLQPIRVPNLPLRLRRLQERPRTPRRPANAKTEHTPQLPPKLALAAGTRAFRVGIQLMRSQVQHRHLRLHLLLSPGPVPLHLCHLNRNLLQVPTMLLKAGAPAWSGLTFRRRCITAQGMSFMARRRMENI